MYARTGLIAVAFLFTAAFAASEESNGQPPGPPESPEAYVAAFFDRFLQGDGEGIVALFHPESNSVKHLTALAQSDPGEHQIVMRSIAVVGSILASEIAPTHSVTNSDAFDDRAVLTVSVSSARVPAFALEEELRLRRSNGGWYAADETFLSNLIAAAREGIPGFEGVFAAAMEVHHEVAKVERDARQQAHVEALRASPEACAMAFFDAVRDYDLLMQQRLRHPEAPERVRLEKLRNEDEQLYVLEGRSYMDACKLVFGGIHLEAAAQEPEAPGGETVGVAPALLRVPLTLLSPERPGWSVEASVTLKRLEGTGGEQWGVFESTITDAVFQRVFADDGELSAALTELMAVTERHMAAILEQRETEQESAEEATEEATEEAAEEAAEEATEEATEEAAEGAAEVADGQNSGETQAGADEDAPAQAES